VLKGHEDCVQNNEKGNGVFKVLMLYQPIEVDLQSLRINNFLSKLLSLSNLLDLNPFPLIFSHKEISKFFLFFNGIEIINNNSYKQVNHKL